MTYQGIIYKATSKTTNKSYIGQTRYTLEWRKQRHYSRVKQGDTKYPFHLAIKELGPEDFDWEVLESVDKCSVEELQKELNRLEIYYISLFNSYKEGYNGDRGGTGLKKKGFKTLEEKMEQKKARRASPEYKEMKRLRKLENRQAINDRIRNRRHRKLAAMTPEELEAYRLDRRVKSKERRDKFTPEERHNRHLRAKNNQILQLGGDLEAYKEMRRQYTKARRAKIKADPIKYEQHKERCRARNQRRRNNAKKEKE